MGKSVLGHVRANGKVYHHVIDTMNDSVYLRDSDENILMEIDHSGNVMLAGEDNYYARWRISDSQAWKLVDNNNNVI